MSLLDRQFKVWFCSSKGLESHNRKTINWLPEILSIHSLLNAWPSIWLLPKVPFKGVQRSNHLVRRFILKPLTTTESFPSFSFSLQSLNVGLSKGSVFKLPSFFLPYRFHSNSFDTLSHTNSSQIPISSFLTSISSLSCTWTVSIILTLSPACSSRPEFGPNSVWFFFKTVSLLHYYYLGSNFAQCQLWNCLLPHVFI